MWRAVVDEIFWGSCMGAFVVALAIATATIFG
jgi:hypothetical protein